MTQDQGIPYRRHKPPAALREFLDPLDPGSYFDCGQARLHGLDDALLREAESRGRKVGDDTFQLVATDMGLIFCRPSISFAIAARWDEVTLIRPHGDDPVVLPVTWPTHGELKFTLSRRLAANVFRRWLQLRMQTERNVRREKAERFTSVELEVPTRTGDWEVVSKVEPPDGEDPAGPTGPEIDRRDTGRRARRAVRDRTAMAKRGLQRDGHTVSMPPGVLAATKRQPVPDELPAMIMKARSPGAGSDLGTETEQDLGTGREVEISIEADAGSGVDAGSDPEERADAGSGVDAGSEARAGSGSGLDAASGVEADPEARVDAPPEPVPPIAPTPRTADPRPRDQAPTAPDRAEPAPVPPEPPSPAGASVPVAGRPTGRAVLEDVAAETAEMEGRAPDPTNGLPAPAPAPGVAASDRATAAGTPAAAAGAGATTAATSIGPTTATALATTALATTATATTATATTATATTATAAAADDDRPGPAPVPAGFRPASSIRTIERPQPTPPSWIGSPMSLAGAAAVISTAVLVAAVAVSAYRRTTMAEIDPAGPTTDAAISVAGPRTTVDHRRFTPLGGSLTTTVAGTVTTTGPASGVVQTSQLPGGPRLCNSNYSGCVPDVSDVDCPNDGDGPLYSTEPAVVMGDDVYELDTDGDGDTCEPDQPRLTDLDLAPAGGPGGTGDPDGQG